MRTLLLLLAGVASGAVIFAVIRAVVIGRGFHRRFANAIAFAVAAAFVLGTATPWSLFQRLSGAPPPPAAPPGVAHPIGCASAAKVLATPGQGSIDSVFVDGKLSDASKPIAVPHGAAVRVGGWLVTGAGPAGALCVLIDGRPFAYEGLYGLDRPDVATAIGKPADRGAGFDLALRPPPGSHILKIGPVQADGNLTPLAQALKLDVR